VSYHPEFITHVRTYLHISSGIRRTLDLVIGFEENYMGFKTHQYNERWPIAELKLLHLFSLHALYIVIRKDIFNNGNEYKYFRNLLRWCLRIYYPMFSVTGMKIFLALWSFNINFRHRFLDAMKCKMHPDFRNSHMWEKSVLESRKFGRWRILSVISYRRQIPTLCSVCVVWVY
jgi:hypothetical protein